MADFPLSAGDLRAIAEALDPLEFLPALAQSDLIGRIEVYRPSGSDAEVIGYFDREGDGRDAWLGFVPNAGAVHGLFVARLRLHRLTPPIRRDSNP